jgi:hypothetical protein
MQPFITKGVIRESWELFKQHWAVLWGALGVVILVNVVFSLATERQSPEVTFAISILSFLVTRYIQLGLMRVSLNVAAGRPAAVMQLFGEHQKLLRYIGASIVYGVIVVCGLLLLIIPGIVWSIKYGYYGLLILDKNMKVFDAISMSGKMTEGAKMQLFGVAILMILLTLVSIIPLGLGLLVTVPMAVVLTPLLYVKLLARHEGQVTQGSEKETAQATPETQTLESAQPFVPLGKAQAPQA